MKAILLSFLMIAFIGCGSKPSVVVKSQIERVKIPNELLILKPLEMPHVFNNKDIITAYADLYEHYKQCELQINAIKELNEK